MLWPVVQLESGIGSKDRLYIQLVGMDHRVFQDPTPGEAGRKEAEAQAPLQPGANGDGVLWFSLSQVLVFIFCP